MNRQTPMLDRRRRLSRNIGSTSFLYLMPSATLLAVFLGVPIIVTLITSFQFYKLNVPGVYFNGLDNYVAILTDKWFGTILWNSARWVFFSIVFQFLLGLSLAMLLNRKFFGKGLYQALVLLPWAVPGFLAAMVWKWMFNGQYGVINDILMRLKIISEPIAFLSMRSTALPAAIVANIWFGVPFFAIMILSALQAIPADVYEAAEIDGAGSVTKFFRITLAYIKPTIISTILLRVIWMFNSADLIYIMTNGGPRNSSSTLATYILMKAFDAMNFGQASALGVLFLILLSGFTVVYLICTKFEQAGDF